MQSVEEDEEDAAERIEEQLPGDRRHGQTEERSDDAGDRPHVFASGL